VRWRTGLLAGGACAACLAVTAAAPTAAPRLDYAGAAWSILPAGEDGGLTLTKHSTDQAKLYDALTPKAGSVTARDLPRFFKPERLSPVGRTTVERIPHKGLRVVRDRFGVAHVYGKTQADVMYATGWITAEDRGLLLQLIRGPGALAAVDGPAYDQSRPFTPSAQLVAALNAEVELLRASGPTGRRLLADFTAYAAGINAYYRRQGVPVRPWALADTVAAAAAIGGRFGTGGGDEARRAQFLSALEQRLGAAEGRAVFDDLREQQDAETPTTASASFPYGASSSDAGNATVDAGSLTPASAGAAAFRKPATGHMSNVLAVGASRSVTGHPLYVAGPQVGYFYPQYFLELDLHGGGFDVRGAVFPGIPLVVIGRGKDFAWSATSSGSDIVDQYVETLCGGDRFHYLFDAQCREMGTFDAGTVDTGSGTQELVFRTTVHGPVVAYATSNGQPVAISTKRSSRRRDVLSALAFYRLDTNAVATPQGFERTMNGVEFAFNWTYVDGKHIAYFSSARLPKRPANVDLGLPARGTGDEEWQGFEPLAAHPHAVDPKGGLIVNWNNKPAPGFAAADDQWSYGSLQRVQLLSNNLAARRKHTLASVVGAMNKAATQDFRAVEVWPVIERMLARGTAPTARDAQLVKLLDAWRANGASRLDRNGDSRIDDPGAAIMDAFWPRAARAVMSPVLGPLTDGLAQLNPIDDSANDQGSSYIDGWYGYVDKDLRMLLGDPVKSPFHERYCGGGDVQACAASLWAALDAAGNELAAGQGPDPSAWRADATGERIVFEPGLIPLTMRWTNRPTFQQAITFNGHRPR
jgi:acyl-homoserine lactone acylase PvdQ